MTLKLRCWQALRSHPMTIAELSDELHVTHKAAGNAIRSMVDCRQAYPVQPARKGHPAVYAATDKRPGVDGRGKSTGSAKGQFKPKQKPWKEVPRGNGAGRIALEEAWPERFV